LFPITQSDSIINLPGGFLISNNDKFRNQQVLVTVEVPIGKNIEVSKGVDDYDWFTINVQKQRNFYIRREWNRSYNYRSNRDYIMGPSGLKNLKDSTESGGDDDDDE